MKTGQPVEIKQSGNSQKSKNSKGKHIIKKLSLQPDQDGS